MIRQLSIGLHAAKETESANEESDNRSSSDEKHKHNLPKNRQLRAPGEPLHDEVEQEAETDSEQEPEDATDPARNYHFPLMTPVIKAFATKVTTTRA